MKRLICLLAITLFSLSVCSAESVFEEIPFGGGPDGTAQTEETHFEEAFFAADGVDSFALPEDVKPEGEPAGDVEERTTVIVPHSGYSDEDWAKIKPELSVEVPKGKGKVALSWTLNGGTARTGLPGDVRFYVYEWLEEKGAWMQAAGPVKGFSVALTNVTAGEHIYRVRLERINKNKSEAYGLLSDKKATPVAVVSDRWKKAPKVKGVQSGVEEVTLTWTASEKPDFFRIYRKTGRLFLPAGETAETSWVDGNASSSNEYRVVPVKRIEGNEEEGKAASVSVSVIEYWKTKPEILSVSENDDGTFTIRWTTTLNIPEDIAEDQVKWDSEFPHAFYISNGSGTVRFTKFDADFKAIVLGGGVFEYTTLDKEAAKKKNQDFLGGSATPSFTVQPAMYLGPAADEEVLGEKSDPFVYKRKLSAKEGAQNVKATVQDGVLTVTWDAYAEGISYFTLIVLQDADAFGVSEDRKSTRLNSRSRI